MESKKSKITDNYELFEWFFDTPIKCFSISMQILNSSITFDQYLFN